MIGDVTQPGKARGLARVPGEVALRIISGLVLAIVAVGATFVGGVTFAGLVIVIALVMAWEWGRIVRQESDDITVTAAHMTVIVGAATLAAVGQPLLGLVVLGIGVMLALVLANGSHPRWSAAGVAYVGLPAVALIWLRGAETDGALATLFLFTVVWTTDTFSYVCGKLIGGPKLWPWLSPNKTWAGTFGGVVFATLAAFGFAIAMQHASPLSLATTGLVVAIATQAGDLGESALKRGFNVRNASTLIPGHGGCMDRMDGIVGAATVAAVIAALRNFDQPAAALLQGL
jgi:phosphatidate cytidylyltransferase